MKKLLVLTLLALGAGPALLVGNASSHETVRAAAKAKLQVRYDDDHKPGQTNGEGSKEFGAEWYVIAPNGKKIDKS